MNLIQRLRDTADSVECNSILALLDAAEQMADALKHHVDQDQSWEERQTAAKHALTAWRALEKDQ